MPLRFHGQLDRCWADGAPQAKEIMRPGQVGFQLATGAKITPAFPAQMLTVNKICR